MRCIAFRGGHPTAYVDDLWDWTTDREKAMVFECPPDKNPLVFIAEVMDECIKEFDDPTIQVKPIDG